MSDPSSDTGASDEPELDRKAEPLERWDQLWGSPAGPAPLPWHRIERASRHLAEGVPCSDVSDKFERLVGSAQLRGQPVHRWLSYKEGYSPKLLDAVIAQLDLGDGLHVADVFGGVATTALAGQAHPQVAEVRSLEYSPWAQFAGAAKLSWATIDPDRLRARLAGALDFSSDPSLPFPHLAAFENSRIFDARTVVTLLSAREHLLGMADLEPAERAFLLLGLGAVVEDLSNAIKDGRALRIISGRKRRASSLAAHPAAVPARGRVKRMLAGQWTAMIEDLESLKDERAAALATPTAHVKGDARELATAKLPDGRPAFPAGWAHLSCFSPPYLNCIDYTEVYKLELWLMRHISTQDEFRDIRLGTLRSHPSVRFPARGYFDGVKHAAVDLVTEISKWITSEGGRPEVGPVIQQYFEDMLQVWRQQFKLLRSGGVAVCVVANSTFSRRERDDSSKWQELWRMPLLTDVVLAHLAQSVGFEQVEIWKARELRPRNVRDGWARESLVVAHRS